MLDYIWSKLYARWLRSELVRPRPQIKLRHGTGKNLILGIGRNYSIADLRPFVRSARKFHDCRILLVVNDDVELGKALEAEGVDYLLDPGRGPRPAAHELRACRRLCRCFAGTHGPGGRECLADTRDVVFQADIFQALPDAPIIFAKRAKASRTMLPDGTAMRSAEHSAQTCTSASGVTKSFAAARCSPGTAMRSCTCGRNYSSVS